MNNIAAISTAAGTGGVAIIRLSGDSVLEVADKMFKPVGKTKAFDFEPYKMYAGEISGEGFCDFGLCVYFKAPKSFTGEDVVELHCHGGVELSRGILKRAVALGCAYAERGEFTRRAFLNGKLSLSSAEGMIDMINSESEAELKAGYYLYAEKLNKTVAQIQTELTNVLASIGADIDFPEEDIERDELSTLRERLITVRESIDGLLALYRTGRKIKNGVNVAITGRTNTGKSSILNALLGYDKAIVSDVEGTTRDAVEGTLVVDGVRFNLYDTAGIRASSDFVENIGIELAEKIIASADLILFVADAYEGITEGDLELYAKVKDKPLIVVFNKKDKTQNVPKLLAPDVCTSAKTGENVDELKRLLVERGIGKDLGAGYLTEERHYVALTNARESLLSAIDACGKVSLDLIGIDVQTAWNYLGEISGQTANENIINEIFSKFCVGK